MGLFSKVKKAFNKVFRGVVKGAKSLLGISMTEQMEKAAKEAKKRYEEQQAAAEATAQAIRDEEKLRKRRLAAQGGKKPSTLIGSYLGLPGQANTGRQKLGGF